MTRGKGPRYYWDSCIFIAHLKGEKLAPEVQAGINRMIRELAEGKALLLTSVITHIEVLDSSPDRAVRTKFEAMLTGPSVLPINCDTRVALLAHELRQHFMQSGATLMTPDAIHLASAITYDVDCFYTLDGLSSKAAGKREVKLLPLSGEPSVRKLRIEVPAGPPMLFPDVYTKGGKKGRDAGDTIN